jgi:hypothetical protein
MAMLRSAALFAAFIMFVRRPILHLDLSPNEHVTTEAVNVRRSCTPCSISRNFEKYYDDFSRQVRVLSQAAETVYAHQPQGMRVLDCVMLPQAA